MVISAPIMDRTAKRYLPDVPVVNMPSTLDNSENFQIIFDQAWPMMDVRNWVEMHDTKQSRMSPLTTVLDSGVVEPADRRELVRIAVGGLVEYNDGNLYPPCQLKTQLAKDIIAAFPKLCSASGGYEHFYDPKMNRGFIEFRLKTLRLKLNPSEKKRATSSQMKERRAISAKANVKVVTSQNLLDEEEYNAKVFELASMLPSGENKSRILRLTEETRDNRQRLIRDGTEVMPLSGILDVYPRFKDYDGEVIIKEFSLLYPNNDLFLTKFPSYYSPRILKYCRSTKPHLLTAIQDVSDDNLKALIMLPELLPSPNYTKRKENKVTELKAIFKVRAAKMLPNEHLLHFVNVPDESALNEIYADRQSPFLICVTSSKEKKGTYYIKTQGNLIRVGNNAINAFDVLVKLHLCFCVPFVSELIYFYNFITGCVMQLNEPKGCCVALNSTLSNITVDVKDPNLILFLE